MSSVEENTGFILPHSNKSFYSRWAIYSNRTTILDRTVDIIYCTLIKPKEAQSVAFTNVNITSTNPKTDLGQVLPIAIKSNFHIPVYVYTETESTRSIAFTKKEELITFGIIHVLKSSATTIHILAPSVVMVAILVWFGN